MSIQKLIRLIRSLSRFPAHHLFNASYSLISLSLFSKVEETKCNNLAVKISNILKLC